MQRSHPADENGEASAQDASRLGTTFVDCWVLLRSDKYHYYYIIITTDVFQLENKTCVSACLFHVREVNPLPKSSVSQLRPTCRN